jgi:hypothetical protein
MLSTAYRLKLQEICNRIAKHEEVSFEEMVWCEKLAAHNASAAKILRQARRAASTPTMQEGDMDDFLNQLDLGSPDPTRHKTGFDSVDEIVDFFKRDDLDDGNEGDRNWRRRD